ncbi:MAG TPA: transcriptional regulator [Xanthobacteraceae bacterium]|jgi:hypothetical protein
MSKLKADVAAMAADPPVYSVDDFCLKHVISRAQLYRLWAAGGGPRRMSVGRRTLITREAAADWKREGEAAAEQKFRGRSAGEPR